MASSRFPVGHKFRVNKETPQVDRFEYDDEGNHKRDEFGQPIRHEVEPVIEHGAWLTVRGEVDDQTPVEVHDGRGGTRPGVLAEGNDHQKTLLADSYIVEDDAGNTVTMSHDAIYNAEEYDEDVHSQEDE